MPTKYFTTNDDDGFPESQSTQIMYERNTCSKRQSNASILVPNQYLNDLFLVQD